MTMLKVCGKKTSQVSDSCFISFPGNLYTSGYQVLDRAVEILMGFLLALLR